MFSICTTTAPRGQAAPRDGRRVCQGRGGRRHGNWQDGRIRPCPCLSRFLRASSRFFSDGGLVLWARRPFRTLPLSYGLQQAGSGVSQTRFRVQSVRCGEGGYSVPPASGETHGSSPRTWDHSEIIRRSNGQTQWQKCRAPRGTAPCARARVKTGATRQGRAPRRTTRPSGVRHRPVPVAIPQIRGDIDPQDDPQQQRPCPPSPSDPSDASPCPAPIEIPPPGRYICLVRQRTMDINALVIRGSDPGAVPGGSTKHPLLGDHGAETGSTNV